MKKLACVTLALALMGAAASAQPRHDDHGRPDNHPGPANHAPDNHARPDNHPGPDIHARPNMGGHPPAVVVDRHGPGPGPAVRLRLPPGFAAPRIHHNAPVWRGRSWAVGDFFVFTGFTGPTIFDWNGYALSRPRPGTHWIYVDGWYLMVGNRTGRIFAEVPSGY